jgi:hypothetical protein
MTDLLKKPALLQLRVIKYRPWRQHRGRRNAMCLQALHHPIRVALLRPSLKVLVKSRRLLTAFIFGLTHDQSETLIAQPDLFSQ